jgi:hypothetical protein
MWRSGFRLITAALVFLPASIASADDLIRSDLPLWAETEEGVQPFSVNIEGGGFGVGSNFELGDWQWCDWGDQGDDCYWWVRLEIGSAIHPRFHWSEGDDVTNFSDSGSEIVIFAPLGETEAGQSLRAVQIGFRGGSRYLLISVMPPEDGLIEHITILDAECEDGAEDIQLRRADFLTIYLTDYCAVASNDALRRLAEESLARPPLATLTWVRESEEN